MEPLSCRVRSDDFEDGATCKKVCYSDDNYDDDCENNSVVNTNETFDSANNINHNQSDGTDDEVWEHNVPPRKNCDEKRKSVIP